eukprot:gi/632977045/ref/XP_007905129.1/ PREDICTED: pleckstrin homology domain-containing family N member 1 isoform X2 [Callorhinchus milii]
MGCISVTARCAGADNEQEEDLVQIPSTCRRQSIPPVCGKEVACPQELDTLINIEEERFNVNESSMEDKFESASHDLHRRRSCRELGRTLYSEPVSGWEGEKLEALGEIVWASQVILYDRHTQEDGKRYLFLFQSHLLLLAMEDEGSKFIYQGLLPLSGISVKTLGDVTFEIAGSMFESRIIKCESQEEFNVWMAHLPRRVKKASVYRPQRQELLSILVPCDELWKKQKLKTYLLQNPIRGWEGTPIQHLGKITFLSMVQFRGAESQMFEERILILFSDELVILSTDDQKTSVQYENFSVQNRAGFLRTASGLWKDQLS